MTQERVQKGRRRRRNPLNLDRYNPKVKLPRQSATRFFCPQCSTPRRINMTTRLSAMNYFQISIVTGLFMAATWSLFSWKGIIAFFPIWMVFEFVFRIRLRMKLTCQFCGFDPYLYLVDEDLARNSIETFWRAKFAEKGVPYPGEGEASVTPAESLPGDAPLPSSATSDDSHAPLTEEPFDNAPRQPIAP